MLVISSKIAIIGGNYMDNEFRLNKEKRDLMIFEIKKYFSKERDEDLGDLGAALVLDFIEKKIAPEFYNQGVYDSYKYMSENIEDMLGIQKISKK